MDSLAHSHAHKFFEKKLFLHFYAPTRLLHKVEPKQHTLSPLCLCATGSKHSTMSSSEKLAQKVMEEVKQQEESTKTPKKSELLFKIFQEVEKLSLEARALLKEEPSVTEEEVWVVHFVVLFLSVATSCSHVFFFCAHNHVLKHHALIFILSLPFVLVLVHLLCVFLFVSNVDTYCVQWRSL